MPSKKSVQVKKEEKPVEKKYIYTKELCRFDIFYKERTKCEMPVTKTCQKCGKEFKISDIVYAGVTEKGESEYICKDCSKE